MVQRTHLLIDLEGTLIDTSGVSRFYFENCYGRNHLGDIDNLRSLGTSVFDSSYVSNLAILANDAKITFVTNAPRDYARALLELHGLDQSGYGLVSSANKPTGDKMSWAVDNARIPKDRCVIVGDSPHDILAAHELGIRSIAVSWGFFSQRKVGLSEPSELLTDPAHLMDALSDLSDLEYQARQAPSNFSYVDADDFDPDFDPEIELLDLGSYHPTGSSGFNGSEHSKQILDIKSMKGHPFSLVGDNKLMKYFYSSSLRNGRNAGTVFRKMRRKIGDKIDEMNPSGPVYIHGLSNSLPASCYHHDVLRNLTHNVALRSDDSVEKLVSERLICRTRPKASSHDFGDRSLGAQFRTMGIHQQHLDALASASGTIVLVDDVVTSGNSFKAAAYLLREKGFQGNLYGIALGRTV